MTYHQDPEVNKALIELMDALCTWERNAGRGSTLILIPHSTDERIIVARDGKPGNPSELRIILDHALNQHLGKNRY